MTSHVCAKTRADLLAARGKDGGWGYGSGKKSRIEPTCWALLALGQSDTQMPNADVLRRWAREDGWLVDVAGAPLNNAFNAIAALTFLESPLAVSLAEPLIVRLVASEGVPLPPTDAIAQDGSLQAWSWIDGTASWVEPTAWCVLLLKRWRAKRAVAHFDDRISVGEQMLFDRACRVGGWNYGNSRVYGQDLWPYVTTTALALLALRDRRDHPVVQRSLQQLQKDVATERSAVALALTVICLRVYQLPCDAVATSLVELYSGPTAVSDRSDNLLALAMTLYALTDRHPAAFAL